MDVIALGKASKTLREIKDLDEQVVAPLAQGRFKTVDARLDWLEGQADKLLVEGNHQVDFSKGVFDNTELLNGKIALKNTTNTTYFPQGTYESPILDLGEGWRETTLVDVVKQIKTDYTDCVMELSSSTSGLSFSEYLPYDPANLPQGRYVKIRATLTAQEQAAEEEVFQYDQSEDHTVTVNEYVKADGSLTLNTDYSYSYDTVTPAEEGSIMRAVIQKSNFKHIDSLEVK
jgi:hypothetical protein